MKQKTAIILAFCLLIFSGLQAQYCPANIDFESGLGSWIYYRGSVSAGPVFSFTATPPVPGLHTLTSGSGTDAYGGFPVVAPGGSGHSLMLGHDSANNSAEKASYFIDVPTSGNYKLVYNYAVVMGTGVTHPLADQPRFIISATDSVTGAAVMCDSIQYISDGTDPGFLLSSGLTPNIYYRPWTTGHLRFAGFAGHTIRLDVTVAGCTHMDHWCYAYFDMSCNPEEDTTYPCGTSTLHLAASDGYTGYHWYDSATFTTTYGTAQTVVVTSPPTPETFAVILTPYAGYGCTDTFYTHVSHGSVAAITGPTALCIDSVITLSDATPGGVWTSSNPAVASIGSSSGVVNASVPGTDTITYSIGLCTTSTVITVLPAGYCTLGVTSVNTGGEINLFPNPNTGEFSVLIRSVYDETVSVTITSVLGIKAGSSPVATNQTIALGASVSEGLYIVTAVSEHGCWSGKLIVAR